MEEPIVLALAATGFTETTKANAKTTAPMLFSNLNVGWDFCFRNIKIPF
jgi:hypothetical protein